MENKKLPSLIDLSSDIEVAFKNDDFNLLLNQNPPERWIKAHPMIKVKNSVGQMEPLKYFPIDKVEYLMTRIFQEWRVEILNYSQIFNSVAVQIRLHYKNPTNGVWGYHDGVGAVAVQTEKGASAADLNAIKSDAVMKALPAAKSYAIKDAADHLGRLFGRDLNRKDTLEFVGAYRKVNGDIDYQQIEEQLSLQTTLGDLNKYWEQLPEYHKDKEFQKLFSNQKNRILKP